MSFVKTFAHCIHLHNLHTTIEKRFMILKIDLFDFFLHLTLANPNLTPNSHKPHA